MTRDDIDAVLRSAALKFRLLGDVESVEQVDTIRELLPETPLPPDWGAFVGASVAALASGALHGVDGRKLECAIALNQMCHDAAGDPEKVPDDVRQIYKAAYGAKSQAGSIGNRKYLAGAFALANRFHPGPSIEAAAEWMMGKPAKGDKPAVDGAIRIGERAGMRFPGLGRKSA